MTAAARQHETDADARAIELMDRAGYDPHAAEAARGNSTPADCRCPDSSTLPEGDAPERATEGSRQEEWPKGPSLKHGERRPRRPPHQNASSNHVLEAPEAAAYLACDGGKTVSALMADSRVKTIGTEEDLRAFLCQAVSAGLMYEENGQYLSLAVGTGKVRQQETVHATLASEFGSVQPLTFR